MNVLYNIIYIYIYYTINNTVPANSLAVDVMLSIMAIMNSIKGTGPKTVHYGL